MGKYNDVVLEQLKENYEPDCEDFYLAEIESKAEKYDAMKQRLMNQSNRISRQRMANYQLIKDNKKLNHRLSSIKDYIYHEYFKREQLGIVDKTFQEWQIKDILKLIDNPGDVHR
jgi:uncharacterized protein YeeX (DUF496 family)